MSGVGLALLGAAVDMSGWARANRADAGPQSSDAAVKRQRDPVNAPRSVSTSANAE